MREALKTDKRAITAGPGNPPAVVDETADIERAARDIVAGASFDNNVICTDEKTAIAVKSIADELIRAMGRHGAHVLKEHELRKVERVIFETMGPPSKPGIINRAWIGKNAADIAAAAGVDVDGDPRLLVAEVPNEHNLVWTEQMMPVLPVTAVARRRCRHRSGHPVRASLPPYRVDPLHQRGRRSPGWRDRST